jgi:hypothetical protein
MTGIELISVERKRQIEEEGWAVEHDDSHFPGCLSVAGASYAAFVASVLSATDGWRENYRWLGQQLWPFDSEWWKPSEDPIRNLVKAGALIAAEIDRLQRKREVALEGSHDTRRIETIQPPEDAGEV